MIIFINAISVIAMKRIQTVLYEDWIKSAKQPIKTRFIFADRITFLQNKWQFNESVFIQCLTCSITFLEMSSASILFEFDSFSLSDLYSQVFINAKWRLSIESESLAKIVTDALGKEEEFVKATK
jgi:hypothetical protein